MEASNWNQQQSASVISIHQLQQEILDGLADVDAEFGISIRYADEPAAEVLVNADKLFPLASVVKVPILIEALAQVDAGHLSLTTRVPIEQEHKLLPSTVAIAHKTGELLTSRNDAGIVYLAEHHYFAICVLVLLNRERLEQSSAAAYRYTAEIDDRIGWIAQMAFEKRRKTLEPIS
jgi:beta-lactamase class A